MARRKKNLHSIYHPSYWLTWLGLGTLYLTSHLPYSWQITLGKYLGSLGYKFMKQRRHIAEVNLKLCFPELNDQQRQTLLKKHFAAMGMGVMETGMAWWMPEKNFQKLSHIEGIENLENALQKGRGVICLCAHFTTLEMAARIIGKHYKIHALYREQKNRLFNRFMERARKRNVDAIIPRDDTRAILKSLKQNIPIYYAADQDYGRKHSIFVPFFGIPAATIMGTVRLAKMTGAAVVPGFHYRIDDTGKYQLVIHPALENFPTDNMEQDLLRINQIIESAIREKPEQYLWTHRRFKTRPEGEARPY